ncbi:hypothetical protein Tco_0252377 [Tanacetum coccineum]
MDITRAQQIACMTLVASPNNCKIGKKESLDYASDLKAKEQLSKNCIQICPKLPNQQFEEPPFEEEILTFLRDLGHSGEIKTYPALLGGTLIYQVENKKVKRSNEIYYPRFHQVIVNFFMTKDSSIPRRNKVNWHFAKDDPMFTTIKVVFTHEDTQLYGAILPDELTNEAIKDSESYKEYYVIALGVEPLKTKASVKKKQAASDTTKTPSTAKGKRLKTSAKAAKPAKKQPAKTSKAKSLTMLSEKSSDKEDDDEVSMGADDDDNGDDDDDADNQDDDDNDDDDQNDDNTDNENDDNDDDDDDDGQDHEQTDSNNDGDDFVHPKFSTHNEEDNEEDSFDPRTNLDEEETNEEDEANELYRDVNVNLEGRDTKMIDALRTIIQTTQVIEDTHVIITPVNPEGQQQMPSMEEQITVRRDDDKLYTFKEGDFNRLRIQDIVDMLLFLVQGKLTNLTVEERLAFNVSLRMFTRSIVIQRRVEDLQLGVESYQKKLNLTKPNTYRSDLKRREAYTAYSNPRCFIY